MTNNAETNPARVAPAEGSLVLPGWAPWSVLVGLVGFGVLGGLGIMPLGGPRGPRLHPVGVEGSTAASPSSKGTRVFLKERDAGAGIQAPGGGPSAAANEDAKVAVAHLVVTHKDTPLGKHKNVSRTREEAKKRAEEAYARAKKGEAFGKLVAEYSDEPGAVARDGKFGKFRHKDAVKPFADAAFALKPGEISPVVESAFGFHVIRRTE